MQTPLVLSAPGPVAIVLGERPELVGAVGDLLTRCGYHVLATRCAREAEDFGSAVPHLELAVAERTVGGGGGAEALVALADRWPGVHCVLLVPRNQMDRCGVLPKVSDVLACAESFSEAELASCLASVGAFHVK